MSPLAEYDAKELRDAALRLHTTMETVLGAADCSGPWDAFQLERFANGVNFRLVTLGMVIENARAKGKCICDPCRAAREAPARLEVVPVAGEGDVITAGELKEALTAVPLYANIHMSRVTTDAFADRIFKHAADSREPEYSPGTVVRDARGDHYQRTKYGKWLAFGIAHSLEHITPLRPLEVL